LLSCRTIEGRGVFDPRSRTGPRVVEARRTPHHHYQSCARDRGRVDCVRGRQGCWPESRHRFRRLHPAIPRQCFLAGRELGSGGADLRCHYLPHCSRRPQNKRRCPMQNWRRWRNENHPRNSQTGRRGGTTASPSRSRTRPIWRWSSKRPMNPARVGFPSSLSVTTANRTATSCATPVDVFRSWVGGRGAP
jgi:hypothetical protein